MTMSDGFKTSNHAAYSLYYHIILTIKYRNRCLTVEMLDRLREIFTNVSASWRCRLIEFGGEADHVHLLIEGQPSMDLARFVGNLKTVSSRYIRKEFAQHLRKFFWKVQFWNNAYAVVSAGGHASIEQLLAYIQDQEQPPSAAHRLTRD
ncbi:IS200/IS605 family transposase [Thiomonas sp. FB-Cd]|uniref:IS200/IS605 family transposase n=1 Tax=Thiomonas sp. FB-Cd TaxID=1158292 RepID=UPI0018CC1F8B|nr:IS200/IS605 family transposase [Thiomonas sp. FB-Cd]